MELAKANGEALSLKMAGNRVEGRLGLPVDGLKERRQEVNSLVQLAVARLSKPTSRDDAQFSA